MLQEPVKFLKKRTVRASLLPLPVEGVTICTQVTLALNVFPT